MYAHQVIESHVFDILINYDKYFKELRYGIKQAQKFHIEHDTMNNYASNNIGKTLYFNPDFLKYAKLPYSPLWIDSVHGPHKYGLFISYHPDDENLWMLFAFYRYSMEPNAPGWNGWGMLPFYRCIDISNRRSGEYCIPFLYDWKRCNIKIKDGTYQKCDEVGREDSSCGNYQLWRHFHWITSCLEPAILLLNCKNIIAINNHPPSALNRKRIRLNRVPLFTYKTLHIKLPNHKNEYSGHGVSLSHNRIHLCRGHFKEYTAAAPLFGKYTGLYWWEPHVRGQNPDGIVMKDYSVEVSK